MATQSGGGKVHILRLIFGKILRIAVITTGRNSVYITLLLQDSETINRKSNEDIIGTDWPRGI